MKHVGTCDANRERIGDITVATFSAKPSHGFVAATLTEGCDFVTLDQATDLLRQTLLLALIVSAPMLVIGLVVGVLVSLFQAVTQIQEQSLTFIPKIVSMVAAAILLTPWIAHRLLEYTTAMFMNGTTP